MVSSAAPPRAEAASVYTIADGLLGAAGLSVRRRCSSPRANAPTSRKDRARDSAGSARAAGAI